MNKSGGSANRSGGGGRPGTGMGRSLPSSNNRVGDFRKGGISGLRGGKGGSNNKSGNVSMAEPKKVVSPEDDSETQIELEGVISSVLAGTMFRVRLANGHEVLAHISGKMRKRFIRLVVGDRVKMEMSPYDTTKARITFRIN